MTQYVRWLGGVLILGGLCLAGFSFPDFMSNVREALHEPEANALDEQFAGIDPTRATWLRHQSGGRWGEYGWLLRPNEAGRLTLALPGNEKGRLATRIWANDPGTLTVRLVIGEQEHVLSPGSLDGTIQKFPVAGASAIEIDAMDKRAYEFLVLDRVAAVWSRPSDRLPTPWYAAGALSLIVLGGLLLRKDCFSRRWEIGVGIVMIGAAVFVGFFLRYDLLDLMRGLTSEPDAVAFKQYAEHLEWFTDDHGFYSGSFREREPLHVAMLKAWMGLWGRTFPAVRWYTVFLSTLVIASVGLFTWRVTHQWAWGALAAWMTALSPAWIDESVKGLRLESMTLLLLATLSIWLWGRGWMGAIGLGCMTGVMALLQFPIFFSMIGLWWCSWALNRFRAQRGWSDAAVPHWNWRHLTLITCLSGSMFAPHLYGVYQVHGDPSWTTSAYARWNANMEFPERIGTGGFPTAEEVKRNPYAGPAMTYLEYLFGLHSLPRLVWGQLKGWAESTIYMSVSATPRLKQLRFLRGVSGTQAMVSQVRVETVVTFVMFLGVTVVGWISLWRHPDYWWVPFFSLLGTWYVAYLYSVRLVEPFRHTGHVYPLLLLCFVMGCETSYRWMVLRVSSSKSI